MLLYFHKNRLYDIHNLIHFLKIYIKVWPLFLLQSQWQAM